MSLSDDTVVASCPNCGAKGTHRRAYERADVLHLRCQSCRSVNAYARQASGPESEPLSFEMLTAESPAGEGPVYSAADPFASGMWFAHSKFGAGYVLEILSPPKKMEVLFSDKRRVLVCGAGSGAAELVADTVAKPPPKKTRRRSQKRKPNAETKTTPATANGPVTCPSCGAKVHPINILHTPEGRSNCCMYCK